ncbi:AT3G08530 [Olea europaea subsp. europaea]|uniref:AT3G08530, partial n=1 Tax=Olea europaea subsp. europaea TaxID=158383 RepID=A0A8S0SFQ1_OLEEU|nr:AT3G08530 [Olea europaea subsp. europaea]
MDGDPWAKVLDPENEFGRQLIDHVVAGALPESKSLEQVFADVKTFMISELCDRESFTRANDATQFLEVIRVPEDANVYHDLVKFLLMVKYKAKEPKVDSELVYAYAKIDRLGEIEEFILMPSVANLLNVGDHLYDEAPYEAAKIVFCSYL